jgi:subtilisin family serine protease
MRTLLAAAAIALVLAAPAAGGRFAIGLQRGASPEAVAARVETATGGSVTRLTPFALVLDGPTVPGAAELAGVSYVERIKRSRHLAFTANDPYVKKQWYLGTIHAFDTWPVWPIRPALPSVKVAVIDSGIDGTHPDLAGRIDDAVSYVDKSPRTDSIGHGTFVAGLIAAEVNNATGIAGVGFPARLLVAKVVHADGTISPDDEAQAIRWAVDHGAQAINLSLAALRDPEDSTSDQYSQLEAGAIDYAVSRGVVVVAAVGNGDGAPRIPWRYASYPAALPHVVGVGAVARDGSVPDFSNRDLLYNDLTAPGTDILSTVPRDAPGDRPACAGYSMCGPDDLRRGEGTSFAAAQVSAAAAILLAQRPTLAPDQVATLLERSASDMTPDSGCKRCIIGRDDLSGWGELDVTSALRMAGGELLSDAYEPNDDAGTRGFTVKGRSRDLHATLDAWDDPTDVYRVFLDAGQSLSLRLDGRSVASSLSLWRPGTRSLVPPLVLAPGKPLVRRSVAVGASKSARFRAHTRGWYFVALEAAAGSSGAYTLSLTKA